MKRPKIKKIKKGGRRLHFSLKFKLSVVMLCGFLIAGAIFFGAYNLGQYLVWRHFANMTEEDIRLTNEAYVDDLQRYININRLSVNDIDNISKWKSGKHVELVFYQDRDLIYVEPDKEGDKTFEDFFSEDEKKKYEEALKNILEGNVDAYPVSFTDGTLLVTVIDGSEEFYSSLAMATAVLIAAAALMIIMILYFTYVTRRIRTLAKTVQKVEAGDMDMPIKDSGHDEIGKLAGDVNSMRNAVVENMSKEREAWEANAGLITAMSHDIRTPLTVMLGYLELMELQNTDPANEEYLEACKQNAMKLKKLSDDMFSYFLVFGKKEVSLDLVTVDAEATVNHMLEEHCVLLSETGGNINRSFEAKNADIKIDTVYFNRVVDNVFSNIRKYADLTREVTVGTKTRRGSLVITIENYIADDTSGAESNGIGLKTCAKVMEQLGGSFEGIREDGRFISIITLPLVIGEKSQRKE